MPFHLQQLAATTSGHSVWWWVLGIVALIGAIWWWSAAAGARRPVGPGNQDGRGAGSRSDDAGQPPESSGKS